MTWEHERQAVLRWWPRVLAGTIDANHPTMRVLEEKAWQVASLQEWSDWFVQVQHLWGSSSGQLAGWTGSGMVTPRQRLVERCGPSLAKSLAHKIDHPTKSMGLPLGGLQPVVQHDPAVMEMAQRLCDDFAIRAVCSSAGTSSGWLRQQLNEARMGLTNMGTAMGLPLRMLGGHRLVLWLHDMPGERGASASEPDHVEILRGGGHVVQAWWLCRTGQHDPSQMAQWVRAWQRSWPRSARWQHEHQRQFLLKSKLSFKSLAEQVDVTSDIGQKTFRRYRAVCKWMDEVQRGASIDTLWSSWNKVKTGNRIAWSGAAPADAVVGRNWTWEEQLLEWAFWSLGAWSMPSWVLRTWALGSPSWPQRNTLMDEDMGMAMLAIGFEGMVRDRIGYDGWLASRVISHPSGAEAAHLAAFIDQHLDTILGSA